MFKISNLTSKIENKKILDDFNLEINDGEIHAIMGKNGIGKSTLCKIILNNKDYDVTSGNIIYNNEDLLNFNTDEIVKKGIYLISQNPSSVEGVTNAELLRAALREKQNEKINIYEFNKQMEEVCQNLDLDPKFIHKQINVGASGGERKKIELLHMALIKPSFIILDEIDSGLDVDALKVVANFINDYHNKTKCSILIITHHDTILDYIKPNYVHILSEGKIIKTGDHSLAKQIEDKGFRANIID